MIIRMERTGGFAGIALRAVIDVETLDPVDKDQLKVLVEASRFFSLPERIPSAKAGADSFHYRLTVEEVKLIHTVEMGESAVPGELQPLIEKVTRLAREKNRRSTAGLDTGRTAPKVDHGSKSK